jgi:hypothetical protein
MGMDSLSAVDRAKPEKWQLPHKGAADAVLVFSKLTSQLFSGARESPVVYAVGGQPFLSVASIARPQGGGVAKLLARGVKKLASWLLAPPEEEHIQEAKAEWEIQDERRVAREVLASEDGRWLAVADTLGRVSIVDCIFGHITKILKGMRDGQVAWSHGGHLLIFAPARGIIVACTVPNGEIFDAVKVDKKGRLFQCVKDGNELDAIFMDSCGRFGQISVERPIRSSESETHGAVSA